MVSQVNNTPISLGDVFEDKPYKEGFIKCRLVHMNGYSVIQPDVLLGDNFRKEFFVPKFFDPNVNVHFGHTNDGLTQLIIETANQVMLRIFFFGHDKVRVCPDGSVIYKCGYAKLSGDGNPISSGEWRRRGDNFQLKLYHHTDAAGAEGITRSNTIWGSQWNIQGNKNLLNIAYGYFTSIPKICDEIDLQDIAMSQWGISAFVPTNIPFNSNRAKVISIPQQQTTDRSKTLCFWVNCELLAPNHLWRHSPADIPVYYEIVLPKVFRVGLQLGKDITINSSILEVADEDRKLFKYVVVGDASEDDGLTAPYNEEETTFVAKIEEIPETSDILEAWQKLANSDQFNNKTPEYASLESDDE